MTSEPPVRRALRIVRDVGGAELLSHRGLLLLALSDAPATVREIASNAGIPLSSAHRELTRAVAAGQAERVKEGWIAAGGGARRHDARADLRCRRQRVDGRIRCCDYCGEPLERFSGLLQ